MPRLWGPVAIGVAAAGAVVAALVWWRATEPAPLLTATPTGATSAFLPVEATALRGAVEPVPESASAAHSEPGPLPPATDTRATTAESPAAGAATQAWEELARDVAAMRATLDQLDERHLRGHVGEDLATKLRRVGALRDPEREAAERDLRQAASERPDWLEPLLAALREEDDPRTLEVIAHLFQSGRLHGRATDAAWDAVLATLRGGQPAARRAAAAWAACVGLARSPTWPTAWEATMIARLRDEPEPEVIQALALALAMTRFELGLVRPGLREAVEGAARRLAAGPARRATWASAAMAVARSGDGPATHALWARASDPTVREEIAAGIAAAGFPVEPAHAGPGEDVEAGAMRVARRSEDLRLFAALYAGTSDIGTRQRLLLESDLAVGIHACIGDPEGSAGFLRALRLSESDPALSARLARLVQTVEDGQLSSSAMARAILYREPR